VYQVVLDTNVLVAALRSRTGASAYLLGLLGNRQWRPNITVALALEYEAVLKRDRSAFGLSEQDIDLFLGTIYGQAGFHRQYFRWRPAVNDPNDDMILEAGVSSRSDFVITFNQRDFRGIEQFGIRCLTPGQFLILLRE
jgi:predicted nucleic acid-binding protein